MLGTWAATDIVLGDMGCNRYSARDMGCSRYSAMGCNRYSARGHGL